MDGGDCLLVSSDHPCQIVGQQIGQTQYGLEIIVGLREQDAVGMTACNAPRTMRLLWTLGGAFGLYIRCGVYDDLFFVDGQSRSCVSVSRCFAVPSLLFWLSFSTYLTILCLLACRLDAKRVFLDRYRGLLGQYCPFEELVYGTNPLSPDWRSIGVNYSLISSPTLA